MIKYPFENKKPAKTVPAIKITVRNPKGKVLSYRPQAEVVIVDASIPHFYHSNARIVIYDWVWEQFLDPYHLEIADGVNLKQFVIDSVRMIDKYAK